VPMLWVGSSSRRFSPSTCWTRRCVGHRRSRARRHAARGGRSGGIHGVAALPAACLARSWWPSRAAWRRAEERRRETRPPSRPEFRTSGSPSLGRRSTLWTGLGPPAPAPPRAGSGGRALPHPG
jgi:hypothetical protein